MDERPDSQPASNVPDYTVSELSGAIKRTLEQGFARVRVRGEITECKRYPSGHIYFSLKDEAGKISAVVWRGSVSRLGLAPENGTEVIATGRVSAYGERSSYQLVVDRLEFAGEGALLARVEALRKMLLAEGLFDADRKRPLPFLPRRVGVVTSRQGAVLHDIRTTIARRLPREVLLWAVAVQGESAAEQIARAIESAGRMTDPDLRPDVLIVARGGGSLEDLMAFNDERVVRAAAASPIPLISAVGHETDTTLIDFASDRRAPTPTAAAELAVPLRTELSADLVHRAARLASGLVRAMQTARSRLDRASARIPDLPSLVGTLRMRLDDRSQRLDLALPARLRDAHARLVMIERRLPGPDTLIERRRARLSLAGPALRAGLRQLLERRHRALAGLSLPPSLPSSAIRLQRARLDGVVGRLEAVSPRAVLARGYALVESRGHPVTQAAQLKPGARVRLHFADGARDAQIVREKAEGQGALDL
ncbi:exodeoxyribonuclease VII large subunit [Tanticharoenia sakaeratensis]|uniref:Exodeoxyribonuclease 7 large subunit n=1 Tax=Tanticharoenia sakaeratensis NBRC 103193 TaxID=1231623 RepID=A0A0D6MKJ9_9PROT|nr:exodeoxyribonuclease VII large subunit [Tanticharoenia sakaeratensis]GAN54167.1 exodeoxyribonuclease VII large subunit [Tanticharoenia sakaeratensis NBRC 103193]GBQ19395.1 exodeoxyribonuclease VII large subunit [Tanticharoenia sakaeratensis NBRC 103193]